ncbi:hypothetical protein TNCV_289541 [Trichonephila clavipes]|nr:hypothetical protein TNCV_289541 [Trichonephila clavipes]
MVSNVVGYLNTIQCRTKIVKLTLYGWTVVLQWVPSHKSKKRSLYPHKLTQKTKNLEKPLETLATSSPIPMHLKRTEACTLLDEYPNNTVDGTRRLLQCGPVDEEDIYEDDST